MINMTTILTDFMTTILTDFLISNRMNIDETFICHNFIEYLYVMKC